MEDDSYLKERMLAYVAERGRRPTSVRLFCDAIGLDVTEFYRAAHSLRDLEQRVNATFVQDTLSTLRGEQSYAAYSGREKFLAFLFTWLESLTSHRSYVLVVSSAVPGPHCSFLSDTRGPFLSYAKELIAECCSSGEIPNRPLGERLYVEAFWCCVVCVFSFWRRDDSRAFARTDAAVEKVVHLVFDLLQRGPVDSGFDLAKFLVTGGSYSPPWVNS